jgi:Fibronectin type III domain
VSATAGLDSATVSWGPPANDGGSPIMSYTVTPSPAVAGQPPVTVPAPATSVIVTGLMNALYTFTVSATNAAGTGPGVASNTVKPLPSGNPNNTAAAPQDLSTLSCSPAGGIQTGGTTANDGSNAWYVVNVPGPASVFDSPCTLNITLSGGTPGVFDLYKNDPTSASLVTGVRQSSTSIPTGSAPGRYYIHIYDASPGPIQTGVFTLNLSTSGPTGNPINLSLLHCSPTGSLPQVSGATGTDGSNSWYAVSVTEFPLFSCTLNITLAGGTPGVFDLYLTNGSAPPPGSTPLVTGVTQSSTSVPTGSATVTYYIHIYGQSPGSLQAGPFTLKLSTS